MKVSVDPNACMGHGQCYVHAPQVYRPDDEGFCVVIQPEADGELLRRAVDGAEACPEKTITVKES